MKSLILILLFALAYADDALDLGDSDFDSKLADHPTALVMFYAPWCGHCKRLKPEFEKAASILKNNEYPVQLVKVDCTDSGKETCSKYGVSGYPTLKIFREGSLSSDYNGPREQAGIVKYMKAQVGPVSTELKSVKEAKDFLSKDEVTVVHFGGASSSLKDSFIKVANKLRETVRFANSEAEDVLKQYGYKDQVVLFRAPNMQNKFEPASVVYEDGDLDAFIKSNYHGLVGYRTQDNAKDFKHPLVIGYYNVDYVKNVKGTNYWRNRIMKVGQDFKEFSFAISSKDDFQHELNEFGVDYAAGDKPVVCAHYKGEKYVMKAEFSMDSFREFLTNLKAGKLEAYIKSEPVPSSQGDVKVAVRKNFDELVTNSGRDALIEFYAPWCGHCKKLAPIFDELGEKMKGEDVDIVKMDATANDVPADYDVKGFPTLFWRLKSGKITTYSSGRELNDFITYIAEEASSELKGWDRNGNEKKSDKSEL